MDLWNILFSIALLALALSPLWFLVDAFNLGISAALVALCLVLPFFLAEPLAIFLAVGPVAIYLILLGAINLARRPFLVSGTRDFAVLALAAAGMFIVGPMELFFPTVASLRFGANVWILMIGLYVLMAVCLVLFFRPRLVIYNIAAEELRPILADLAAKLDAEARWAGDNLSLPAQALARRVQGFAAGGLVQPAPIALARPVLADSAPVRTVRVELAAGDRTVHATLDERDESRLLQLLDRARARAI